MKSAEDLDAGVERYRAEGVCIERMARSLVGGMIDCLLDDGDWCRCPFRDTERQPDQEFDDHGSCGRLKFMLEALRGLVNGTPRGGT